MPIQGPNDPKMVKTKLAGGDMSAFRIVTRGTDDNHIIHATGNNVALLGVTLPDSGADPSDMVVEEDKVDFAQGGFVWVEYGGTVALGDDLTSDANGKAVATTTQGHRIIGQAQISGVDGDIGSVLVSPGTL